MSAEGTHVQTDMLACALLELFQPIIGATELQMALRGAIFLAACHFPVNSAVVAPFVPSALGKLEQAGVCVSSERLRSHLQ